nr:MAG TPA: hypothetical protein [Caudoviricetes sp.]
MYAGRWLDRGEVWGGVEWWCGVEWCGGGRSPFVLGKGTPMDRPLYIGMHDGDEAGRPAALRS